MRFDSIHTTTVKHFALTKSHKDDQGTNCPVCQARGLQYCVTKDGPLPENEVHLERVRAMGLH